ncbi:EAL domain-containing protein [Bacillus mangrovi]|uniref:EAL domain-containing protein n=1 Tax=Metabacillus mangrovi TaxID=1491830 RepID=A0A7X2S443_9BACI|nr:EAL domain-containing protein [Metabacillus mangrovi]MTH53150.1 EAL domain-containing protein [Metabacillus mangrovi]
MNCSACSPDLAIPSAGYLIIDSATGESDTLPYKSEHHLASLLEECNKRADVQHLRAALTEDPGLPTAYSSFSYVFERVVSKETVDIIMEGDFSSFFQPIIQMESGQIFGYESLLRHAQPAFTPYKLFDTAIKTGLQSVLDRRARELAIIARSKSVKRGIKSFINFIPSSIYNPAHCLQHTFRMVKQYRVSPEDLIFEVVETEKINDIDHLKSILDTYRANGMKVALDDMGSGYSTYEVLEHLKPDFVKIDRSFISDCHNDSEKQSFLKNVQALAQDLSITVLGEGIETAEEFTFLQSIGIALGQGYYIGKPAPEPASGHLLFA